MKVVTHSGNFHADEVMAVAMLCILYGLREVSRVRRVSLDDMESRSTIVIDIGGEHDPRRGNFDHHQKGGAGKRPSGVPYAAFGLVWAEYGSLLVRELFPDLMEDEVDLVFHKFDKEFVALVDGVDTGHSGAPDKAHIARTISSFNTSWWEEGDEEDAFEEALEVAEKVLKRQLEHTAASVAAQEEISRSPVEGRVLVLDRYVPIMDLEIEDDILYVVYPSNRGSWMVQQIPVKPGSFEGRKKLPKSWAGLKGQELADECGVEDAVFCHNGRFIGGADTKTGAIEMAQIAVEA